MGDIYTLVFSRPGLRDFFKVSRILIKMLYNDLSLGGCCGDDNSRKGFILFQGKVKSS